MDTESKVMVRIWPDWSYVRNEDWNEEEFRFKGDDYTRVYIPEEWDDKDLEDFIQTLQDVF